MNLFKMYIRKKYKNNIIIRKKLYFNILRKNQLYYITARYDCKEKTSK